MKNTTFVKRLVFVIVNCFVLVGSSCQVYGQDSPEVSKPPFHKWEVGIDILPIINKGRDSFGYVVKRNFETSNKTIRKSLRFRFLPAISLMPSTFGTPPVSSYATNLAVGYERQDMFKFFALLHGVEPFVLYNNSANSSVTDLRVGASVFIGGRYYIGEHFAFTVESHLVYQYQKADVPNFGNGSAFVRAHSLQLNPVHSLYLSYHF